MKRETPQQKRHIGDGEKQARSFLPCSFIETVRVGEGLYYCIGFADTGARVARSERGERLSSCFGVSDVPSRLLYNLIARVRDRLRASRTTTTVTSEPMRVV